jgi:SAM-dependent methyltransferase
MHQSVLDFGQRELAGLDLEGQLVIEVGSLNVNGSLRPFVEAAHPEAYWGIDLVAGPGVDVVGDFCDYYCSPNVDLIICTEMLEHAPDWRKAITKMKHALRPGGVILLTTRSIGFARHHEHPGDFWRFSMPQIADIFGDFWVETLEPDPGGSGGGPGVFLKARKPHNWVEKDLSGIEVYSMMENEPA